MGTISTIINKDIGNVLNSTSFNELQNEYNTTEQKLISLLDNPDSLRYKKCYRKLVLLDRKLDEIQGM